MQKAFKQCARVCQYVYVSISIVMFSFCEMGDGSNIKKLENIIRKTFRRCFCSAGFFFAFHFAQDWRLGLNTFFSVVLEFKLVAFSVYTFCRMAIMGDLIKARDKKKTLFMLNTLFE